MDKLAINWKNFARVRLQVEFACRIRPWVNTAELGQITLETQQRKNLFCNFTSKKQNNLHCFDSQLTIFGWRQWKKWKNLNYSVSVGGETRWNLSVVPRRMST